MRVVRVTIPFLRPEELDALLKSAGIHVALMVLFLVGGWILRSQLPAIQSTRVRLVGALEVPRASPAPSRPETTTPRPEPAPAPRPEPEQPKAPPEPPIAAPGVEPIRDEPEPVKPKPEPPKPKPKQPKPEPATAASGSPEETSAPPGPPGPPAPMATAGDVGMSVEGGADGLPDFYLDAIVRKVSMKWLKPTTGLPAEPAMIFFQIDATGRITTPSVERASGSALYDRAALRAIELAAPFGPLPKSRSGGVLKVHFVFTP